MNARPPILLRLVRHILRPSLLRCAIVFIVALTARPIIAAEEPRAATPARGPLRVHPDNPRYFTDGTGKTVYLTGSHIGWELQDHSWGREHVFDFAGFVGILASHQHNFMRLWMVEHTRCEADNPLAVATPMPYRRTGPGLALDGQPKFDLEQFDPAYFERLRARVQAAGEQGIYVAVMLFHGFSLHRPRNAQSPKQTEARTRGLLAAAAELKHTAPVHHQEPFRRGYGSWEPVADGFLTDLRDAVATVGKETCP